MLGIGGKFAASKGMVSVPNLVGLSSSSAQAALLSSGLIVGSVNSTSTSNSSINGQASSQTISAGTLVDYETVVGFTVYSYVAPPPPSGPYIVSSSGCIYSRTVNYRIVCVNNSGSGYPTWDDESYGIHTWSNGTTTEYSCGLSGGNEGNINGGYTECGYVQPSCSGSYAGTPVTGSCSGGEKCTSTPYYNDCGQQISVKTSCTTCCTAGSLGCSTVTVAAGVQVTTCTYRRSDCTTYTTSTTTCSTSSSTSCGSCVYAGYTIGSYKSCTTTTRSSSCTTSTSTKSVKC